MRLSNSKSEPRLAMGIANMCNTRPPDAAEAIEAVIEYACDSGFTLVDVADAYAPSAEYFGYGETVMSRVVRRRTDVTVMTKVGHTRPAGGGWDVCGTPAYIRNACLKSIRRLGLHPLPMCALHRPDPNVPLVESLHALKDVWDDGLASSIALSNVNESQLTLGIEVLGPALAGVQNELSIVHRNDDGVLSVCESHGLQFWAYAPLGGRESSGVLSYVVESALGANGSRHFTPQEASLAWLSAQSPNITPIVGVSSKAAIDSCRRATRLQLTERDYGRLSAAALPLRAVSATTANPLPPAK